MSNGSRIVWTLALACAAACAQTPTSEIKGSLKDAGGAAVAGAEIKITDTATGAARLAASGVDGGYVLSGLPAGTYSLEVTKTGFETYRKTDIVVAAGASLILDATLSGGASTTAPSLSDLGFSPAQAQGSSQEQARLDRRSHMLKIHQRMGLITLAPLLGTFITSSGAAGRHGTDSGRQLHAAFGATTAALYFTTASFAIFAPKVQGTPVRGPIRLHRALAWIHGPGMVLTPVLGAMAFSQLNQGQRVHGIAKAHSAAAWITGSAYAAAMLSVSIKF